MSESENIPFDEFEDRELAETDTLMSELEQAWADMKRLALGLDNVVTDEGVTGFAQARLRFNRLLDCVEREVHEIIAGTN